MDEEYIEAQYKPPTLADGIDVNWNAKLKKKVLSNFVQEILPNLRRFINQSSRAVITPFNQDELVDELRMVVPVSGGIDSCTSAWLCAETLESYIACDENILTLLGFIGNGLNQDDQDALMIFKERFDTRFNGKIQYQFIIQDIGDYLASIKKLNDEISNNGKIYLDLSICRIISMLTMCYADRNGCASIDSTNKGEVILSEIAIGTGYEVNPLGDLYKSLVYELAEQMGVPKEIINRDAQNSSLGNRKVDSYFSNIPERYNSRDVFLVLDPVLHAYENNWTIEKTVNKYGHGRNFIENVFDHCEKQRRNLRRDNPFYLKLESEMHGSKIPYLGEMIERKYHILF